MLSSLLMHCVASPRAPALRPFIKSFHYHRAASPVVLERIVPNGQAHLMINLAEDEFRTYSGLRCQDVMRMRGAVLAGPHARPVVIDTREQHWLLAIEFRLGGAAPFFADPISEARDLVIDLGDLWACDGRVLRERLLSLAPTPHAKFLILEDLLLQKFSAASDPAISFAVSLLDAGVSISDVRLRLGMLPKTFLRRFRERVGLTPKRFFRVRRLQRIVGSVCTWSARPAHLDWCRVAADHGFADQAHLIHDFRDLTGMTPTAYKPHSPQRRNHVPISLCLRKSPEPDPFLQYRSASVR
jgi:AraC-like DNA-binding protein